jgi:hypothetical protein
MTNIFVLDSIHDFSERINIDELYDGKKAKDLNKLALFQKILNRVHVRIKTTSKQKTNETFCWFIVPEVIIGVPKYDQAECIAYILDKLQENGFKVQYFHPNTKSKTQEEIVCIINKIIKSKFSETFSIDSLSKDASFNLF